MTAYFKNNKQSSSFYDNEGTYLELSNETPGKLENYNPGIHKKVADAVRHGAIVEITEAEYNEYHGLSEATLVEEKTQEDEELEEKTQEDEKPIPNVDDIVTKEEMFIWLEEQNWISKDELDEFNKIKKFSPLKDAVVAFIAAKYPTKQ
jgi:hypothetical protein